MIQTADYWIQKLGLEKHPEGGWFREVYRSTEMISKNFLPENLSGPRNCSTSIYYLLEGNDFSAFHRIKSDEIWHFYVGSSPIEILSIVNHKIHSELLGNQPDENQSFQRVVPKNTWFAARLPEPNGFALVGCTVSPGFHYNDFELAGKELIAEFPLQESQIRNLVRY